MASCSQDLKHLCGSMQSEMQNQKSFQINLVNYSMLHSSQGKEHGYIQTIESNEFQFSVLPLSQCVLRDPPRNYGQGIRLTHLRIQLVQETTKIGIKNSSQEAEDNSELSKASQ